MDPTKVKGMLAKGFGDDASNKMLKAAGMLKGQARSPSLSCCGCDLKLDLTWQSVVLTRFSFLASLAFSMR